MTLHDNLLIGFHVCFIVDYPVLSIGTHLQLKMYSYVWIHVKDILICFVENKACKWIETRSLSE